MAMLKIIKRGNASETMTKNSNTKVPPPKASNGHLIPSWPRSLPFLFFPSPFGASGQHLAFADHLAKKPPSNPKPLPTLGEWEVPRGSMLTDQHIRGQMSAEANQKLDAAKSNEKDCKIRKIGSSKFINSSIQNLLMFLLNFQ